MIRNTDPGSNAGLPGLSLYAGMTPAGLPVGLEIDGPVGSDAKLLAVGLAIEALLGSAPAPFNLFRSSPLADPEASHPIQRIPSSRSRAPEDGPHYT